MMSTAQRTRVQHVAKLNQVQIRRVQYFAPCQTFLNEQDLNYMTDLDVGLTLLNIYELYTIIIDPVLVEFQISLHRIFCTMSCCVITIGLNSRIRG